MTKVLHTNKKLVSIIVDKRIEDKIVLLPMTSLDPKIENLFNQAFKALADQLVQEKIKTIRRCNCIIANTDEITFVMDNNENAVDIHFCIYPVHRWLEQNFSLDRILVIIVEELCHFYWSIDDEMLVKTKMYAVLKKIQPGLQLVDVYNLAMNTNLKQ